MGYKCKEKMKEWNSERWKDGQSVRKIKAKRYRKGGRIASNEGYQVLSR